MKSIGRIGWIVVCLFSLAAVPAKADVRIVNVAVSPHVMLEIYKAYQENRTNVPMVSPRVFLMDVSSDQVASAFRFRLEIWDGKTRVADTVFQTTTPLRVGHNVFTADQIGTIGNRVNFNDDYVSAQNLDAVLRGDSPILKGDFYLVLTPENPAGPSYRIRLALFASPAAQNLPPLLIYPKDLDISTLLPNLVWSPGSRNAKTYEVLVSPNQDPQVNIYWRSGRLAGTQILYPPSARTLENGEKYYWQVIAYDEFGSPVGGMDGKSIPAWFRINSATRISTAVTPPEVDRTLRQSVPDAGLFADLKLYQPVGVETTHPDLAELLRQLRDGSAKITSFELE
ncbi:MAG: hypothetical protein AB1439_05370 [candidate division FCPU426 bacterium]